MAGAIASHDLDGEKREHRVTVTEMAVRPDARCRGLGGFMLGQVLSSTAHGVIQPTELVVDTTKYEVSDEFLDSLTVLGFRHTSKELDDSPAMWTPGDTVYANIDWGDAGDVAKIKSAMPDTWTGYLSVFPETHAQFEQYKDGKLVGVAIRISEAEYDEQFGRQDDYAICDPGGLIIDSLEAVSRDEALRAILNNYDLV